MAERWSASCAQGRCCRGGGAASDPGRRVDNLGLMDLEENRMGGGLALLLGGVPGKAGVWGERLLWGI